MSIKYSVVIPLYNKEECIEKTIRSVLAQTVSDYEIVVVNDGSKDKSVSIVEDIYDKRIRIISQENQGVAAARNTGILNAKGQFVCFLDADDLWKEDFLRTVDDLIENFPEAKVFCPSYEVSYGKRVIVPEWKSVDLQEDSLVNDFFEMATGAFWVTHSSCAVVRKDALQEMEQLFPVGEKVYEDFDFWLRLGARVKVAHSNKVCGTYVRITPNNARMAHSQKVVYSRAFMSTLDQLIASPDMTAQQVEWLMEIKDRRMVPYIFSLLCVKKNTEAQNVLGKWIPVKAYRKYHMGLKIISYFPHCMVRFLQVLRYYIF